MIVIVDYKTGNSGSILNMLKKIGAEAVLSDRPDDIADADQIILPGVGSFDRGMDNINRSGLREVLDQKVRQDKTPVLGICLGMQLLMEKSEEGRLPGLGWLEGEIVRFRFRPESKDLKVPHMGWNTVQPSETDSLFKDIEEPRYYFVHSFHVNCRRDEDVLATTDYGYEFASAVHRDNIWGTQFHPEKSHRFGWQLLKNFVERT